VIGGINVALQTSAGVPYEASFVFEDDEGKKSSAKVNLPSSLDILALDATVLALGPLMAALSNAKLTGASVARRYTDPVAIAAVAPPESEVERKGRFNFRGAGNVRSSVEIPSVLLTLSPGRSDDLDLTNAAVAAFVDAMINVALGAGNSPVDDKGNDLTALVAAYEMHRYRKRA